MKSVLAGLGALILLILHREYSDWAARVSRWMVHVSAGCSDDPARWRDEWLAEVEVIQSDDSEAKGLGFAASIFAAHALTAPLKLLEPRNTVMWLLMALAFRSYLMIVALLTFSMINPIFDRRKLRRLPEGMTLTTSTAMESEKRLERWPYYTWPLTWIWLGAEQGHLPLALLASIGWALWLYGLRHSPTVVRFLADWDRRRYNMLDPRR